MPILLMTSMLLAADPGPGDFESTARALVGELSAGAWAKAVAQFSPQVAKGLPAESLAQAQAWAGVVGSAGAFQQVAEVRLDRSGPSIIVDVTCTFAKAPLIIRVVLDVPMTPTRRPGPTSSSRSSRGVAAKLKVPILVLQGERDYQVTMTDFAGWKQALGARKTVTLKSYLRSITTFMPGTGKSSAAGSHLFRIMGSNC